MSAALELDRSHNNNLSRLYLGDHITVWFSYETPVAFAVNGMGTFKSENVWSGTTKKHLASIPGIILERDEFEKRYNKYMSKVSTAVNRITPNI